MYEPNDFIDSNRYAWKHQKSSSFYVWDYIICHKPVGKIAKKTVWRSAFLIHSYRLLFRRFCPLGTPF